MTGIYDALQQAQKLQGDVVTNAEVSVRPVTAADSLDQVLIDLYFTVCRAVDRPDGRIVAFIAPAERVGASALVSRFATCVAQTLSRPVLLINVIAPAQLNGVAPSPTLPSDISDAVAFKQTLPKLADCELYAVNMEWSRVTTAEDMGKRGSQSLFEPLRSAFDLILVQLPAVESASAALPLVREVDGAVLVVEAERTRWHVAKSVQQRVESHGGTVLGVILNKRRHYIPKFLYRHI